MSAPRSGELFAGVGGLGLAVDDVFGSSPAWFCEFDSAPSKVLEHRYPGVPNHGDVTKVTTVERVEILAGGFPCQDVSLAGRRRGMKDGTRSGLWSEFARLIDQIRPDWVVIENVRGLLSADASGGDLELCPWCVGDDNGEHTLRALGAVLGDLAELGFDAEWTGIRASDVGAPHGRFRVFILAWPAANTGSGRSGGRTTGQEQARRDDAAVGSDPRGDGGRADHGLSLLPTPAVVMNDGEEVASWMARRERIKATGINGNGMGMPLPIAVQLLPTPVVTDSSDSARHTTTTGVAHAGTSLTDALRLLPTPNVAMADGGQTSRSGSRKDELLLGGIAEQIAMMPTPRATRGGSATEMSYAMGGARANDERPQGVVAPGTDWGPYAAAVARWERIVGRPAPSPVRYDGKGGKARLNPELTEWMMGWPLGWVTDSVLGLTRAEQLKACGNGVVPQQAAAALRELLSRPGVPALTYGLAA